jgi:hypothetical protein
VPSWLTFVEEGEADFVDVLVVFVVVDVGFIELEEDLVELELDFELDELLVPQVPPAGLQPVPQYAEVEPHHPLTEQQLPKVEPIHVIELEQVPSVDIVFGAEEVEVVFEDVVDVFGVVEEVVALDELLTELELEELVQLPPKGLHPVPQYA